ncbi:hypothetical protein DYB28_011681 [Aphanomyces astaci]|uniref:Uncharacterized protein n=1 Tax=Aphanomyces astaci TaxID=112090 RepID=A0A397CSI4_APHAT|nr:hypothetical protein DYB25_007445 [Aphanomyces astaci]RHY40801.1 hypothetical protein DYB34_014244 [Aphanomyces astaci]RHY48758.1 hypothetical protein DYB30_010561 [Aphanomyces astaci]RHZ05983.1 hypothetical protein DYB26_002847 [Aphanomyces astaci]RLO08736.1 hypothetical protein DYB28_011681 [Aphanomyces astaci]
MRMCQVVLKVPTQRAHNNSSNWRMATESLKGASFRKKLVTRFKPKESDAIPLARGTLRACHGQDIKKKSGHRKGKFLFAFPGLVSPMPEGGTLGTLDKLDTDKPVLYIDFPQGRLKMQGTLVYAQNRYFAHAVSICHLQL